MEKPTLSNRKLTQSTLSNLNQPKEKETKCDWAEFLDIYGLAYRKRQERVDKWEQFVVHHQILRGAKGKIECVVLKHHQKVHVYDISPNHHIYKEYPGQIFWKSANEWNKRMRVVVGESKSKRKPKFDFGEWYIQHNPNVQFTSEKLICTSISVPLSVKASFIDESGCLMHIPLNCFMLYDIVSKLTPFVYQGKLPAFPQLKPTKTFISLLEDEPPPKKAKVSSSNGGRHSRLTKELRNATWQTFAGLHQTRMPCGRCGTHIEQTSKAGWEASHFVADAWFKRNTKTTGPLTKYDMTPWCRACNLTIQDRCIWDVLYEDGNTKALIKTAFILFEAYCAEYNLNPYKELCWHLVLVKLHGKERFPNGGGVSDKNFEAIRQILALHQFKVLEGRLLAQLDGVAETRETMQQLLT